MVPEHPSSNPDQGVRSVARALAILESISEHGTASICHVSRCAGLPKATTVRIVQTLIDCGYVRQTGHRASYCVTSKVNRLGARFVGLPSLLEAAMPVADALTARTLWPV